MLELLTERRVWERFYEYKTSLVCPEELKRKLRKFIDEEAYLPAAENILAGGVFPLPQKKIISKLSTQKKRTVFTYPERENTVLKLLTYLLLRKYDGVFTPVLYSFRPGRTAKDAVLSLLKTPGIAGMYSYKVDVSDYFNSIPVERLLPMLEKVTADDAPLYAFLSRLLSEPKAIENGRETRLKKGIMAGTPLASFYANLYLNGLDRAFFEAGVPYARYSDDIILFAKTREEVGSYAARVRDFLSEYGLTVNPSKEEFRSPEEGFTFLGFICRGGTVDISPVSVRKLKAKMRRKSRALARWRDKNGLEGEKAAKAFIRIFNRKLFENPAADELTWTYWFFPVITTAESLREIDRYAQDCVRFLLTGTRTKARFNARYADMKALGLRSLVHAYYDHSEAEHERRSKAKG